MANEVTLTATLNYADSEGSNETLQVADKQANVASKIYTKNKQNIGTTEEAIKLGEVASLGWAIFINRDPTNFINIKAGTGGTVIVKLLPGELAMFRFGSGITAPFAIADTAPCQLEYMICSL